MTLPDFWTEKLPLPAVWSLRCRKTIWQQNQQLCKSREGAYFEHRVIVTRFITPAIIIMPMVWSKLNGRGRAQTQRKMFRKGKFWKVFKQKLILKQRRRGKFHKKNHQSQFCKSKNETESPWIIFTYTKTETRGSFIFKTEARTCLLFLICSNVFSGFIWQWACCCSQLVYDGVWMLIPCSDRCLLFVPWRLN